MDKMVKVSFAYDELYTRFPHTPYAGELGLEDRIVDVPIKEWKAYVKAENRWHQLRGELIEKYFEKEIDS